MKNQIIKTVLISLFSINALLFVPCVISLIIGLVSGNVDTTTFNILF